MNRPLAPLRSVPLRRWLIRPALALCALPLAIGCHDTPPPAADPLPAPPAAFPTTEPATTPTTLSATLPTTDSTTDSTTEPATRPSTRATAHATTRPTTRPVIRSVMTNDGRLADPEYYFNKPGVTSVRCGDFDTIFNAAQTVIRDYGFLLDRLDYRDGLVTTQPLVSKQSFEPWKHDIADFHSQVQSDLGSVRRKVHFQITRQRDDTYLCVPKVVVERQSSAERRISSVSQYRDVFSYTRTLEEQTNDEDAKVILEYWYAIGRDPALEKRLGDALRDVVRETKKAPASETDDRRQ